MTTTLATETMTGTSAGEAVLFWVLGVVGVVGALGVVMAAKAVYSAMFLAMTMIILAVFYIAQDALFLGVVQVVVYTGAVMMLFLFVLMLIGVDSSESLVETIRGQRIAAVVVGLGFGILLIAGMGNIAGAGFGLSEANAPSMGRSASLAPEGNVQGLAALIFTRYLWAFELTGALLITAAAGAMVLAHRERLERPKTQRELAQERFRPGGHPTTLPNPGVYAHHNAVDTPALLPDGSPARQSVSRVLQPRHVTARRSRTPAQSHLRLVTPLPNAGADWVEEWVNSAGKDGQ
jgi:NADH-quinone oxidoreductase subunit J